ncbi:MAG TPA: autotransporter domain-containing protein, partial [Solirubrobacteraceae bacterium]|nr:autotransporter domain-containing protein [Solirubrobacteraceae bacterium]
SGNHHAVGQALDIIQNADRSTAFQSVSAKFFAIPTDQKLASLYDNLSGEGASGDAQTALAADDLFITTTAGQLAAWRRGETVNSMVTARGPRLWAAGYGGGGALSGRPQDNSADLGYRGGGLAAGLEQSFGAGAVAGLALGLDSSSFDIVAEGGSGQANAVHGAGYGAARTGRLYGLGLVEGDFFGLTTDRAFSALGAWEQYHGYTHATSFSARAEVGYGVDAGPAALSLFAAVQTSTLWTDGYAETTRSGPDLFALSFAPRDTPSVVTDLGFQIEPRSAGGEVRPFVRLAWRHQFDPARGVTPTFAALAGATPFDIVAAPAASDLARVETGLDW